MRWAELIFHVLAHVRVAAPASAYDRAWIDFVARHAKPGDRTLPEDAELVARAAPTHDALAHVQLLAWLFRDVARAAACSDRSLDRLSESDVDDPRVLRTLQRSERLPAIEVLRAAAELELEVVNALPPPSTLPPAPAVAPWVARFSIAPVRPLRVRGRVFRDEILVGVPCAELGPDAEHVAWQAAHEATVSLLRHEVRVAEHHPLEHAALVLLSEHAARIGQREAHARWLAHFANVPSLSRDTLTAEWRAVLDQSPEARW